MRRPRAARRAGEAEHLLFAEPAPAEPGDRYLAEWHLAAGEIALELARGSGRPDVARLSVAHLHESALHAAASSLVALRIPAVRMLGHACTMLGRMDDAVEAWADAHRLDESVARLQLTDCSRIQYLQAAPDEFDERIRVADRAIRSGNREAAAAVVVAMEAARGAAILHRILPGQQALVRDLPRPGDIAGSRRWVRRMARMLPRSQLVWMLHATPDQVHHAFIGRGLLRHVAVPCERGALITAIEAVRAWWSRGHQLVKIEPGSFDRCLHRVADLLCLRELVALPDHVERIAVIAGGDMFDIPFAALPCPGSAEGLVGRRYALSDLPCLSVRLPLARRARRQRGTRMLLLSPHERLTAAIRVPGRKVLEQHQATPTALREALAGGRYHQVRIDSHGEYGGASSEAFIQLAPDRSDGLMRPDDLQAMNLGACGTLVLGACETGMATRIGRDERTGFVRAALLSGTSAVLAARWVTPDAIAARVLDSFDRYLRHHPRDVALFLAQRDEDARGSGRRPHAWACWTLYGDAGDQARYGPLRRWLSRRPSLARPRR